MTTPVHVSSANPVKVPRLVGRLCQRPVAGTVGQLVVTNSRSGRVSFGLATGRWPRQRACGLLSRPWRKGRPWAAARPACAGSRCPGDTSPSGCRNRVPWGRRMRSRRRRRDRRSSSSNRPGQYRFVIRGPSGASSTVSHSHDGTGTSRYSPCLRCLSGVSGRPSRDACHITRRTRAVLDEVFLAHS